MKKLNITALFLLSSFIVSCGFHLRGTQDFSTVLPEVAFQGESKHSELGRELIQALSAAKTSVLDESDTVLMITQNSVSKRVLSLDSAGRANQYELSYRLSFSLLRKVQDNGKPKLVDLIPPQSINEKREYLFDANLVLSKADEENQLNNDMREKAILQLMRRLKFLLKKTNLNKP